MKKRGYSLVANFKDFSFLLIVFILRHGSPQNLCYIYILKKISRNKFAVLKNPAEGKLKKELKKGAETVVFVPQYLKSP